MSQADTGAGAERVERTSSPEAHRTHGAAHSHEHPGHTQCSEVLLRLFEYVDGELAPDEVRRFAEHLRECGPCLAEHDMDRTMKDLVRRSCACTEAPRTLRLRVVEQITVIRSQLG